MAELRTEAEAPLWGVSAEFHSAAAMIAAIAALQDKKLGRLDAYSPVPSPEAAAMLRQPTHSIQPFAIGGAVLGFAIVMGGALYATGYDYVFNVGGRPRFSWPSFVVPSLSFAMLVAAVATIFAFSLFNRLPRLNHPAFNIPNLTRSTQDRFFVAVEATDDTFDPDAVERAFGALPNRPNRIDRVPR